MTNKNLLRRLVSDADVSVDALLFSQLWIRTGQGEDPNMQTEMCRDQTSPRARAWDRYFVKTNDRIKMKTVSRDILCWFTSPFAPHQPYFWLRHQRRLLEEKKSGAGLFKWFAGPWLRYELARGAVHDKWVVVSGSLPSHHYLLSQHILWPSGCQQTRGNVCAVFIKKAKVDIIKERVVDCRERRKQTISEYDLGLAMGRSVMRCICGMCFA